MMSLAERVNNDRFASCFPFDGEAVASLTRSNVSSKGQKLGVSTT